jgi:hypothetical protein
MRLALIIALIFLFSGVTYTSEDMENREDKKLDFAAQKVRGSGIVFFRTTQLEKLKDFYIHQLGCQMWIDQGGCAILRYGNLLVGFCKSEEANLDTLITFFFEDKRSVDLYYEKLRSVALSSPKENRKYRIYHFYARDPEGRSIEFQCFLHPIDWSFDQFN